RVLVSCLALAVLVLAALTACLIVGDYSIPLRRIPAALFGSGERLDVFFVRDVRLPRALTAALVGAALGTAGAVFQSLSRNPLGSPDIIGFTAGASTGAVLTILVVGGCMLSSALGAMLGGVGTSVLVYLLALRCGEQGYLLFPVGIVIISMLTHSSHYPIYRSR